MRELIDMHGNPLSKLWKKRKVRGERGWGKVDSKKKREGNLHNELRCNQSCSLGIRVNKGSKNKKQRSKGAKELRNKKGMKIKNSNVVS